MYSDSVYVQIKSPCKECFPSPLMFDCTIDCTGQEADIEDVSVVSQWDNSVCDSAGDEIGINIVHCSPVQFPCTNIVFSSVSSSRQSSH